MSAENDVPLGGDSRRYYEDQFGERIRKVNKGGGGGNSGGSNWNGRAGIGITIGVIFIILRIVVAISRTSSSSSDYTPPVRQPVSFADLREKIDREVPRREPPPPLIFEENDEEIDPFFTGKDVPLPQGLCYRIQQESRQPKATPGKHIFTLLTAEQRILIAQTASGQKLTPKQQEALTETWNNLLRRADLYDNESFVGVRGVAALRVDRLMRNNDVERPDPLFHRRLLEKCYPRQIVPLSKRKQLDEVIHEPFLEQARSDLRAAQRQYEPAKP